MRKSQEFSNLVDSADDLRLALESNPGLITEQDEEGMTLLHHAAKIGHFMGSSNAGPILEVLFLAPGLDFSIQDTKENTPLHVAALCCKDDRVSYQCIFPSFVKEAVKRGFDFSTLGQQGQSVLHMATRNTYTDGIFGRRNNVKHILEHVPNSGLNVLSTNDGCTAFYYAVNHCYFDEANTLLDAGADPTICGSPDRDPFAQVEEHLKTFTEALTQDGYSPESITKNLIEPLNALKQRMLLIKEEISARAAAGEVSLEEETRPAFRR